MKEANLKTRRTAISAVLVAASLALVSGAVSADDDWDDHRHRYHHHDRDDDDYEDAREDYLEAREEYREAQREYQQAQRERYDDRRDYHDRRYDAQRDWQRYDDGRGISTEQLVNEVVRELLR